MFFTMTNGLEGIRYAREIRRKVFVEEQGVPIEMEQDTLDEKAYHLVLFNDGHPIGTGRILLEGDVAVLGRIAVLKEYREEGYGGILLMKLMKRAKNEFGMRQIELHAQVDVIGFYEKYGFHQVGSPYIEAGIEHQSMALDVDELKNYGL